MGVKFLGKGEWIPWISPGRLLHDASSFSSCSYILPKERREPTTATLTHQTTTCLLQPARVIDVARRKLRRQLSGWRWRNPLPPTGGWREPPPQQQPLYPGVTLPAMWLIPLTSCKSMQSQVDIYKELARYRYMYIRTRETNINDTQDRREKNRIFITRSK